MACSSRPSVSTKNVPLFTFDLLACVIPMRIDMGAALLCAFDTLCVDDCCRWTGLARRFLPAFDIESMVDAPQRAIPLPAVEVVVHRAARRQVLRDCAPLAAGAQEVH